MPIREQILSLPLFWLIATAAAVAWTLQRGWWKREALDEAPDRSIGLVSNDLLIAGGLWLLGGIAGGLLFDKFKEEPLATRIAVMIAGQFLNLGLACSYLAYRASMTPGGLQRIGLRPRNWSAEMGVGLLGGVIALAVVPGVMVIASIVMLLLGQPIEMIGHDLLAELVKADSPAAIVLIAISAIGVAPILEEIFYRGFLQSVMVEILSSRWWSVILTSLLFAAVHTGSVTAHALPALFVLGLLLGWLYERTGSLLPSIVVHMIFNATNITYILLIGEPTAH